MRKIMTLLSICIFLGSSSLVIAQKYKPYILAGTIEDMEMKTLESQVKNQLTANGFDIVGSYNPMQKKSRVLIAVTHPALTKAVTKTGGYTGFALIQRVALTRNGNSIDLSYTNPEYWAAAYFQNNFGMVSGNIQTVSAAFKKSFSGYGLSSQYGSKNGLSMKSLKKYHYMMGMPYFQDNVELATFNSFAEAVANIDKNFKQKPDLVKVYEKTLPGKKIKLYGVGLKGKDGENKFMPVIDISSPKHTAFLPYEMLVYENKVYMLHGRFRIALSFPDLTMGTFMKIVSTPGQIEKSLAKLCE